MADATGPQLGPVLRGGGPISPTWAFVARLGFLDGLNTSKTFPGFTTTQSISNLPIWVGVRWYLTDPPAGFFVLADVAFNILIRNPATSSLGLGTSGSTDGRAGFNAGFGGVFSPKVPIEFSAQFSYFNLLEDPALFGVGLSVGYSLFL
jgi:hypothetical protein